MEQLIKRSKCPITGVLTYLPLVQRADVLNLCIHQNKMAAKVFLNRKIN